VSFDNQNDLDAFNVDALKKKGLMEPAVTIIKKLGGAAAVAEIARTALSAPYRWQSPRHRGGTGGCIPQRHHRALLAFARKHGIALAADEFLPRLDAGTSSSEVARWR
jgi:hypothetical protein